MITLSEASKDTKQAIKFGIISVAVLFSIFMLFKMLVFFKNTFFPTPPPKPTVTFGKLIQINFPQNKIKENISYNINTVSGYLPNISGQARIIHYQGYQPDLLALQKAKDKVNKIGFHAAPNPVSETIFQWKGQGLSEFNQTLTYDITDNNFTLISDFITNQNILTGKNLPEESQAVGIVKSTLENMDLATDDLNTEDIKVNAYSIKNGNLIFATSRSNTHIYEVYLKQADIDNIPVFYDNPKSSNINFLVSGGASKSQIVRINYFHQDLSEESATYPLKTVSQAFEQLKNGDAYLASFSGGKTVDINNAFLAYYIGSKPQEYLMPIIIFTGSNNFTAYVPAVTDEWISK